MMKKKITIKTILIILLLLFLGGAGYFYRCIEFAKRSVPLKCLSTALLAYVNDHGGALPPIERWSDIMIEEYNWPADYFENNKISIAMNIYLRGMKYEDIPNDMVIFFEAEGGKNLCGGPELIQNSSYPWQRCAIQFGYQSDCIRFCKKSEIEKLRWKP